MRQYCVVCSLFVLLLPLVLLPRPAVAGLETVDLGALGGVGSAAEAVNTHGHVVGGAQIFFGGGYDGPYHAFRWTTTDGMQDLGTFGGFWSHAEDINDNGQIVGYAERADETHRAFLWTVGQGMIDLGTLGGPQSSAYGINKHGHIVGSADTADGTTHAFLWKTTTGMQDLGTLGGDTSTATSVNDRGDVVGYSETADGTTRAFVWTASTGMQDLGTLGEGSFAYDINNHGQVVGETFVTVDSSWVMSAFVWTASTGMRHLKKVIGPSSSADEINDRGLIVGWDGASRVFTEKPKQAVYWKIDPQLVGQPTEVQLIDQETESSRAYGVNQRGQIVGVRGPEEFGEAVVWFVPSKGR